MRSPIYHGVVVVGWRCGFGSRRRGYELHGFAHDHVEHHHTRYQSMQQRVGRVRYIQSIQQEVSSPPQVQKQIQNRGQLDGEPLDGKIRSRRRLRPRHISRASKNAWVVENHRYAVDFVIARKVKWSQMSV